MPVRWSASARKRAETPACAVRLGECKVYGKQARRPNPPPLLKGRCEKNGVWWSARNIFLPTGWQAEFCKCDIPPRLLNLERFFQRFRGKEGGLERLDTSDTTERWLYLWNKIPMMRH